MTGLNKPHDVDIDSNGNIYIANTNSHDIRKWEPGSEASANTRFAGYTNNPGATDWE